MQRLGTAGTTDRTPSSDTQRVAKIAITAISSLIVMKVIASIMTGSIGIRADAIHSAIDLSGAVIGLIAIKLASRPPDDCHAYGHSKIENIAGVVIAFIIFLAAATIAYESLTRLFDGTRVEMPLVGVLVTAFAVVVNTAISWYALRVARAADSVALEATARDMLGDVMSSLAVLIGLILVSTTGLMVLDPIVALFVAAIIVRVACITMGKSVRGLLDTSLPPEELDVITGIINGYGKQVAGWHKLRTRKAGAERFIDFHLLLPGTINVEEAHSLADQLQREIQAALQPSQVTIHIEPCDNTCSACSAACDEDMGRPR